MLEDIPRVEERGDGTSTLPSPWTDTLPLHLSLVGAIEYSLLTNFFKVLEVRKTDRQTTLYVR